VERVKYARCHVRRERMTMDDLRAKPAEMTTAAQEACAHPRKRLAHIKPNQLEGSRPFVNFTRLENDQYDVVSACSHAFCERDYLAFCTALT